MSTPGDHAQPARAERVVRVFISSTFRDMHAERDHLVTVVFPELRERVEQLGLEFFDVDLRWGVPARDANGETSNSWAYCRQWIDRVEPFFVCILGQRYGWIPGVEDFTDPADRARQSFAPRSITDLEVRHAVLDTRRKRRSYFYLREALVPLPPGNAAPEDTDTYREFVDPPAHLHLLDELKAEIRACGRPVRGYPCVWTGNGFTSLEEFGRLVLEDLWSGVLRDERYVSQDVWRQALGADPDADPRYTDEAWPVPRDAWERIVALARPAPALPLDAERQQMDDFAASRLRWFQGRTRELQELVDFLASTEEAAPRLAVVAAVPGQGKSALIARLAARIDHDALCVITHFVGTTERSASAHALVQRLLAELDRGGIAWAEAPQTEGQEPAPDFNSLCIRLAERLGPYAGQRRVVILLDALNQLSDGHDLQWLPARLGPGVRVVVTCVDDAAAKPGTPERGVLSALASRHPPPLRVSLGPLTGADVRAIVVEYLREYCKELDREHVDAICRLEPARTPLYLLVMLAELRTLGGNDMNRIVGARIAALERDYPDTKALFRWVLQRLDVFGGEAVRWWCRYLAQGRAGMASHELADLLGRKLGRNAGASALLIERGLRRYLLRRGAQLDFFHGQLRQAALEEYGLHADSAAVHLDLANYFTACARGSDPTKEWETSGVRGFAECVHHLAAAGRRDDAAGLLCCFPFLLHKLRVGLLEGVFEDYEIVCRDAPAAVRSLTIWTDFFRGQRHILRRGTEEWPAHKILLQLAVEHADDSPLTQGAEQWLAEGRCDWLWYRRIQRLPHVHTSPCVATMGRHSQTIDWVLVLRDDRILAKSLGDARMWDIHSGRSLTVPAGERVDGADPGLSGVIELSDGRLLCRESHDLTLRDGKNGACLARWTGHSGRVNGVCCLSAGRVVSWADDTSLRVWDVGSGVCSVILQGHRSAVTGAIPLEDGRVVSWSGVLHGEDHDLRVWDSHTGACLLVLRGHGKGIQGAHELADGRLASWSDDMTIRVWDSSTGACLATLNGHTSRVASVLVLADGGLLSWGEFPDVSSVQDVMRFEPSLRIWDSRAGTCVAELKGHTSKVNGALELQPGRLLSWACDKTLRIWDLHTAECTAVLNGHTGIVEGALVLRDGHVLSWSLDTTLRMWDARTGHCAAVLEGHTGWVNGATELPSGQLLSWSFDATMRIWNARAETSVTHLPRHQTSTNVFVSVAALSENTVASWADDSTIRIWDRRNGACSAVLEGHTSVVSGVLPMPGGCLVSWAYWDLTIRVWDAARGISVANLNGHTDAVTGVMVLPDGRLLSRSHDKTLRVWDPRRGTCVRALEGHSKLISGVIVLANGALLSWSADGSLRIWDSVSGRCQAVLAGHGDAIRGARELADGRVLSWSQDATMRLWDRRSGACLAVMGVPAQYVDGLLLPSGSILSSSGDKTWRVWDGATGACLHVIEGRAESVDDVVIRPDTTLLASSMDWGSRQRVLRVFESDGGTCLASARESDALQHRPQWVYEYAKHRTPKAVARGFHVLVNEDEVAQTTCELRHRESPGCLAMWQAESVVQTRLLGDDGTCVVGQKSGDVCVLKLHHGNRHVSLAEAETLLAARTQALPR